jgi:hypothetical protein
MEINRSTSAINWDQATWASKLAQANQQAASHKVSVAPNGARALQESFQLLQASAAYRQTDVTPDVTYANLQVTANNWRGPHMEVMKRQDGISKIPMKYDVYEHFHSITYCFQ